MGENDTLHVTKTISLLADNFNHAHEIYEWLRNLIGRPAPNAQNYFIENVVDIQLDITVNRYKVRVWAEIKERNALPS
ncbi:MAG: hypothetical protein KDJ52_26080 [Anaerolineae bacterium]|nr:hypothetical protein [Anaerolineae bacterium]